MAQVTVRNLRVADENATAVLVVATEIASYGGAVITRRSRPRGPKPPSVVAGLESAAAAMSRVGRRIVDGFAACALGIGTATRRPGVRRQATLRGRPTAPRRTARARPRSGTAHPFDPKT